MVSTLKFKIFLKFFLREANFLEDSHWVIKFQKKRSVRFVEHLNQHRMGYLPKMVSTLKFKIFLISNSWNQELEANWNFLEDIICQDKHFKKTVPRRVVGRRGGDSHEYFFSRQNGELQSLCGSRPSNFFLNVTVAVKMRSVGRSFLALNYVILLLTVTFKHSGRFRTKPG